MHSLRNKRTHREGYASFVLLTSANGHASLWNRARGVVHEFVTLIGYRVEASRRRLHIFDARRLFSDDKHWKNETVSNRRCSGNTFGSSIYWVPFSEKYQINSNVKIQGFQKILLTPHQKHNHYMINVFCQPWWSFSVFHHPSEWTLLIMFSQHCILSRIFQQKTFLEPSLVVFLPIISTWCAKLYIESLHCGA